METTQQAPWLSEEERPTWLALVGVLIKLPAALDEQLQQDAGMRKLHETAPGHAEAVRRLVFDPLTKTQVRQLREILHRIIRAIAPDTPEDGPDLRLSQKLGC